MIEVSVWAVRVGTVAAFAAGAGFGWLAKGWWQRLRVREARPAVRDPRLH